MTKTNEITSNQSQQPQTAQFAMFVIREQNIGISKLVQAHPIARFDGISVRKDITRLTTSDKIVNKNWVFS